MKFLAFWTQILTEQKKEQNLLIAKRLIGKLADQELLDREFPDQAMQEFEFIKVR
jgi:hypothetical protein